jgi:hypothetical protein
MDTRGLVIAPRFAGPPRSGNGGYTCGRLASVLSPEPGRCVRVTLRHPPPLATPLQARATDGGAALMHGDLLVAEADPAGLDIAPVEAVSLAEARAAEAAYAGLRSHPFPTCFTCGTDREPGDALRLQPGPAGDRRTACTWTPHQSLELAGPTGRTGRSVAPEFVWAALDCPGGWTADLEGRPLVLGRMSAQLDGPVRVGEPHLVMGELRREDDRKTLTATTLYDSDGRVVARAEHVWIAVDPARFG